MLPAKLRIGHLDVSVQMMTEEESEEVGAGVANPRTCTIKIDGRLDWQLQVETLWHEVLHFIHFLADLGDESKEEEFVARTTPFHISFFRDNPEFRKVWATITEQP